MTALVLSRNGTVFERHTHRHDGLELVLWLVRPPGEGPFPLLVVNHGSGLRYEAGRLAGDPSRPTLDPENPAHARIADSGALALFPEGRGYGGSEGENPLHVARRGVADTFAMLQGRAGDANAAADWACARPDVDAARCVVTGSSHGGVVSLLAGSARPWGAVIAQATGAAYGTVEAGVRPLANAAARITAPVLFQHMLTDTDVPPAGARQVWAWSSRQRAGHQWREYPGAPGVGGHNIHHPANWAQARGDYVAAVRTGFAQAPSVPADPPEQWTALDFVWPPTLRPGAPRWSGRFGQAGPDAAVALDGERAAYAWKDTDSRGYGEGPVTQRGDALGFEPWPGTSIMLFPLPGDAWEASFERGGRRYVTRMERMA